MRLCINHHSDKPDEDQSDEIPIGYREPRPNEVMNIGDIFYTAGKWERRTPNDPALFKPYGPNAPHCAVQDGE